MKWNDLNTHHPFWVSALNRIMFTTDLPYLGGKTVYIASDYGGDQNKSRYETISILFCDIQNSQRWFLTSRELRGLRIKDGRRINFKSFNDHIRQNILDEFLAAADFIDGILVSFVLNKEIIPLIDDFGDIERWKKFLALKAEWKPKEFARMSRIVHFVAVLIGGFLKTGQNAYWISDQDNMFANPKFHSDVGLVMGKLSGLYVKVPPGELGLGTTSIDEGHLIEEELCSITDLTAGALAEIVNVYSKRPEWHSPDQTTYFYDELKGKSQTIGHWISGGNTSLKKLTIVVEPHESSYKLRVVNLRRPLIDVYRPF